jgi:hypothetical protein
MSRDSDSSLLGCVCLIIVFLFGLIFGFGLGLSMPTIIRVIG